MRPFSIYSMINEASKKSNFTVTKVLPECSQWSLLFETGKNAEQELIACGMYNCKKLFYCYVSNTFKQ